MDANPASLRTSISVALLLIVAGEAEASSFPSGSERPNVILIITDDQGYGDIGVHGNSRLSTPKLDRLWLDSVRLTDFHVDPTCSPTRSALMSGRYSTRTGVWHTIMGRSLMDSGEETLAELFRANGYRTGMFGKWHLGDNYPNRPQDQGFEHVVWHHGGGVGQGPDYWDNDYFDDTYEVNGEWKQFEGYCTDVWFREATAFIEAEDDRPFFAYLSTNAPHGPFRVAESYSRPYSEHGVPPTMAKFYGMIANIDENLGRLRAHLKESGLAENTLLLFMTDNGTAAGHGPRKGEQGSWGGYNSGMRGQKGSEYEGGHRVPCFVTWPAGGIRGGRDVDALAAHVDLFPTLAELCGLERRGTRALDGASLAAALRKTGPAPEGRTLFVHSQRVASPEKWRKSAVMSDRWRLVNGVELYDLRSDPGQTEDLAATHPDRVEQLRARYDSWWDSLEPHFEEPDSDHDRWQGGSRAPDVTRLALPRSRRALAPGSRPQRLHRQRIRGRSRSNAPVNTRSRSDAGPSSSSARWTRPMPRSRWPARVRDERSIRRRRVLPSACACPQVRPNS